MQNDDQKKLNNDEEVVEEAAETPAPDDSEVTNAVETAPTEEVTEDSTDSEKTTTESEDTEPVAADEAIQTEPTPEETAPEEPSDKKPLEVEETNDESSTTDEIPSQDTPGKWYVVHTYSGHENKVAAALRQRIEAEHLEDKIIDILVPTQNKIEIKGGRKTEIKEKIFPGYILVKMVLDDTSWLAVRTIPGVTSFVGMGNKPTVISDKEVSTIIKYSQIEQPTFKQVFSPDDTVKIADGPFAEMIGKVDSVDSERGKVKVLVSIFGRETPVELDFLQVQKI